MPSSSLPSSISPVVTFSTSMSLKACITLSQRYSSSFFLSNLSFWILRQNLGPSLQNPENTAEKSEFRKLLDEPVLQNPEKLRKNEKSAFREFFGSPKNRREPPKIQILKPVHCGKTTKKFLDKPILQNPKTLRKNQLFEKNLGSPKSCKKPRKNPNFVSATFSKICLKNVFMYGV